MRISKMLAALGAFFVVAVAVAGCGSSVPGDSVASVAGNPITLQAYHHWMYVVAKGSSSQTGGVVIVPSDPPKFKRCIAEVRAGIPSLASSPGSELRSDCKQVFTQFNTELMNYLIAAYWYQAEAHKQGIKLTNAELMKTFDKFKKQLKTKAAFANYLTSAGQTKQDVLFQMRVGDLYEKLLKRAGKKVNAKAIAAYYAAHKSQFATPQTRDLHLIRTANTKAGKAAAEAAYNALSSGQSWDAVAKHYAADPNSKTNGGLVSNLSQGADTYENAVNAAIFSAQKGKLIGPIHGTFGYYVLQVLSITPANQKTLSQATSQIKSTLTQSYGQTAAAAVLKQAKTDWRGKTQCRSPYSVPYCSGYTAPKTTTTSVPPTTTPTTPPATTTGTGTGTSGTGTGTSGTGTGTTGASTTSSTGTGTSTTP